MKILCWHLKLSSSLTERENGFLVVDPQVLSMSDHAFGLR